MSLIRGNEKAWGYEGWTVIDPDDQLTIFRAARGKQAKEFPSAAGLLSAYSFARNTKQKMSEVLKEQYDLTDEVIHDRVRPIIRKYEAKKQVNLYLDYDDILIVVGTQLQHSSQLAVWVAQSYRHVLVDEFQDTNPIQWDIIAPLISRASLFFVGDDAQSIYGFRGADFERIHSFTEQVPGSERIALSLNYRSTQGILDLANWLLEQSPLDYSKKLVAHRGSSPGTWCMELVGDPSFC